MEKVLHQVDTRSRSREEAKHANQGAIPCGLLAMLVAQGQKGEALTSEEASAAFAAGARAFKTGNPDSLSSLFD